MKKISILAIFGLIATPAFADIASKDYVDNAVGTKLTTPSGGSAGQVLKKTANGTEWANEITTALETTTGQSTTSGMTQKAITDELNKKLENTSTLQNTLAIGGGSVGYDPDEDASSASGAVAIGPRAHSEGGATVVGYGASSEGSSTVIGKNANGMGGVVIGENASGNGVTIGGRASGGEGNSVTIGDGASSSTDNGGTVVIGPNAAATSDNGIAIGKTARSSGVSSIAIGDSASATAWTAIQLGYGVNSVSRTFNVGFGNSDDTDTDQENYRLLNSDGSIPAGRLTGRKMSYDSEGDADGYIDDNGVSGQLLQTNGDGTMSWVDAPETSLESMLPTAPNDCKASDGQKCALVITWSSSQNKFTYDWEIVRK